MGPAASAAHLPCIGILFNPPDTHYTTFALLRICWLHLRRLAGSDRACFAMASLFAHTRAPLALRSRREQRCVPHEALHTAQLGLCAAAPRPASAGLPGRRHFGGARQWELRAVKADGSTDTLDAAVVRLIADLTKEVDTQLAATVEKNCASAKAIAPPPSTELRSKTAASLRKLSTGLLEREMEVRLLLLAALCGEHILFLGPPGTSLPAAAVAPRHVARGA